MVPFIVIEGIDGSGKGTQVELLGKRLEEAGVDVMLTFEPTRGPIGEIIRDHMRDPSLDDRSLALLFAADRIEHIEKEISPALLSGRTGISDWYAYSSIAYQGQTVDPGWVGMINSDALRPDLVVILDMGSSEVRRRIQDRGTTDCFEEDLDETALAPLPPDVGSADPLPLDMGPVDCQSSPEIGCDVPGSKPGLPRWTFFGLPGMFVNLRVQVPYPT